MDAQRLCKFRRKLHSIGFSNDQEPGIICRFKIQGITVDIMPIRENVIRLSNKWYPDGYKNAMHYEIDDHVTKILALHILLLQSLKLLKADAVMMAEPVVILKTSYLS